MSKGFVVTKISKGEIDQIEQLWCELKQHHHDRTTHYQDYYQSNTFAIRKAELLSKERLAIFTAILNGFTIGFCVVSTRAKPGEVDSLYVQPGVRGSGAGRELMKAGINWLTNQELEYIRLLVDEGNEGAIAYYEKLGFRKRATMMQLRE